MLSISPIPAFSDNYIWAIHSKTHCYVVDPGAHQAVQHFLAQHRLILSGILITHHHPDHTGGIQQLVEKYAVPVYGPENYNIKGITQHLKEGDEITVLNAVFNVIATPGHTLDHIAFYTAPNDQPPALFCGDTLFSGGCGRLFEGTATQMQFSIDKLASLPENTELFCAHEYTRDNLAFAIYLEPDNTDIKDRIQQVDRLKQQGLPSLPSSLAVEKKTNPFLRTRNTALVNQIISRYPHINSSNPVAIFGAIRTMKDNF
ncbi:MAG: hydroxyacylglutathione hydrolase [Endozoicomonas sp. (ex Botrylloides leachii)]|nr:hydroxyacylglutathione hydrolase [Endozoicomonas sp. (ex Botrylloides leachii)]